jgi:NAD(P)-dependent dehydrogenase (short-subunit alcohol dehydrogenase family)
MGLSTAETLFAAGYSLALVDLNQAALEAVATKLNASANGSQKAWAKATDVGSTPALKELFKKAQENLGLILGVAHCAGILGSMGPVHLQDEAGESRCTTAEWLSNELIVTWT